MAAKLKSFTVHSVDINRISTTETFNDKTDKIKIIANQPLLEVQAIHSNVEMTENCGYYVLCTESGLKKFAVYE